MSDLRNRINAILAKHYPQTAGYQDEPTGWCQCGMPRDHVADLIVDDLTRYLPPIVASAIHAYADSELIAMDYHGFQPGEREAMKKLNSEAAQIANYATTHEKWNGHD